MEDRILLSCIRLHILRASKHMFSDRSLLRALLLRLCSTVKPTSVVGNSVEASPNSAAGCDGDMEASGVVTSTPQKADLDQQTSINESLKQVCISMCSDQHQLQRTSIPSVSDRKIVWNSRYLYYPKIGPRKT